MQLLKNPSSANSLRQAFDKMLEHFIDADFLYDTSHEKIILLIYEKDFYAHHYAYALPQILNMDNKLLLASRKNYLQLFAKYYLGITQNGKSVFLLLYAALEQERRRLATAQTA